MEHGDVTASPRQVTRHYRPWGRLEYSEFRFRYRGGCLRAQDMKLRAYCRNSRPEVQAALCTAFQRWAGSRFGGAAACRCDSPARAPPPGAAKRRQLSQGGAASRVPLPSLEHLAG